MNAKVVPLLAVALLLPVPARAQSPVTFDLKDASLQIQIDGKPFGQNTFTKGEKSKVVVRKGETFRLRYGVLVHSGKVDVAAA